MIIHMEINRCRVKKQLVSLLPVDQIDEVEQLLYDQSVVCVEYKGGELIKSYNKLCYERLGELADVPPEERLRYIREEVPDPQLVWGSGAYQSFRRKELDRREFIVDHSMGMTVKRGDRSLKCRDRKCASTVIAVTMDQTHAGDEGMTSTYECVECGNKWKEY